MPYKRILISLDCKKEENNVIHEAVRVARSLDAGLTVIHVNDPGAGKIHMMLDSLPVIGEKDLRNQFRQLGYETVADEIEVIVIASEDYAGEIAKASAGFDLLITGHHAKNRLLAALIDSTDERVSDLVSCPMLIVPCDR